MKYRQEQDTMGTVKVPAAAYYGAQTQRAVENFGISGLTLPPEFTYALTLLKKAAARANRSLGLLAKPLADAITQACDEVLAGRLQDQFVVDVFQTGSGTSTNMNMNEVLAARANEILSGIKQAQKPVHPNDHVNMGQSSNDVIPSAMHVAALMRIENPLLPALQTLHRELAAKSRAFADVRKIGRTHLQDAVPMTLGDEFSGYARQIEQGMQRLKNVVPQLAELALGGTAVGSGLNAHPQFAKMAIDRLCQWTGLPFSEARNHFEAQAARDAAVAASAALRTLAVSLTKIANDIRWLSSGPRCGLGEIRLPALQPGSSIMPGKINPVIPEALLQVAAQVVGNDTTIMLGGQSGNFELNVMMPVIAHNLLQSIALTASAVRHFAEKCVRGITADRKTCAAYLEKSLALVTALVPTMGYEAAAAIAKAAHRSGRTIREVLLDEKILSVEEIEKLF